MLRALSLSAALLAAAAVARADTAPPAGFTPLFDGKSLTGWTQKNGTATYRVEDGCVVGKTAEGSPNSFLCTDKEYGDFELHFRVKLDNPELNSGVQIRSASKPDRDKGRVHGPQVEVSTDLQAGRVYGEGTKFGWLAPETSPEAKKAFRHTEWNDYRVVAKGPKIQVWVNGVPVTDFEETKTGQGKGFIGLQVHGIGKGKGPYQVRWKDIAVKELD